MSGNFYLHNIKKEKWWFGGKKMGNINSYTHVPNQSQTSHRIREQLNALEL
jgi:hypothetical protein